MSCVQKLLVLVLVVLGVVTASFDAIGKPFFIADRHNVGSPALSNLLQEALYYRKNEESVDKQQTMIQASYFLKDLEVIHKFIEASECRINFNVKYPSILTPWHGHVLWNVLSSNSEDVIRLKLEENVIALFNRTEKLSHFQFYNFADLLEPFECLLGFQEFGQVIVKMLAIKAKFVQSLKYKQATTISTLNDTYLLTIPLSGEFECKYGKSKSCTRPSAHSKWSKYKFFDS